MPFELAAFDIAGTTVEEHNAVYIALEQAVREVGADPSTQDVQRWMGADKTEAITALLTARGAVPVDAEVSDTYADFRSRLLSSYESTPPTALPGVEDAIATLRSAGLKVALTTGFSREVTDLLIKVLGWESTVDTVVSAEEVGAGRPAPYMIFEAMRRTGVFDVRKVITAGDTVLDLWAGTNSGAGAVVGVLTGAMDESLLMQAPHTHLLSGVAEIPPTFLP